MNTTDLLVEIGTEELPPKALKTLGQAFADGICAGLTSRELSFGDHKWFATPRRLAVLITDVVAEAPDKAIELLGPPADRAKEEDGSWSKAAAGFARKNAVDPEQLEIVETDKGPRLAFRDIARGTSAKASIATIIKESLEGLPIPKRMRWGAQKLEFVRPLQWVLVLLGEDSDHGEIFGLPTGNTTRGHRFHSEGSLEVKSPGDYESVLHSARVVANYGKRRQLVEQQVKDQAQALGATAVIDEGLLDEVTSLVEWPVALTGKFDQRFLEVPSEALISSMKEHQKYFHLVDDEGQLLPNFITVANIESTDPQQVIEGNERVIRARLADAAFFFETDKKISLADRREQLKHVVFQQKLGTLYDKTHRVAELAVAIGAQIGADDTLVERAAQLCKTDLLTDMVGEFSDMQGIAGYYYAKHDGEAEEVCTALRDYYLPKFAGDALPPSTTARALALADRLDTLVGIFGIGQPPTGSRDPFALRRTSLAVLRIMVEAQLPLDLRQCLQLAVNVYDDDVIAPGTVETVLSYMLERFRAWYEDENIAVEVFRAVSAKGLSTPLDIHQRVQAVHAFSQLTDATALAAANKRVSNLLEKAGDGVLGEVAPELLQETAEKTLADMVAVKARDTAKMLEAGAYTEVLAALAELRQPVDTFFDEVMVMVDDAALRQNRLSLLQALRDLFLQVADISQLVVSK